MMADFRETVGRHLWLQFPWRYSHYEVARDNSCALTRPNNRIMAACIGKFNLRIQEVMKTLKPGLTRHDAELSYVTLTVVWFPWFCVPPDQLWHRPFPSVQGSVGESRLDAHSHCCSWNGCGGQQGWTLTDFFRWLCLLKVNGGLP